jgi:hypothetical protein
MPVNFVSESDGFREGLNPPYELKSAVTALPKCARSWRSLHRSRPLKPEHRSVAWLDGQAPYWHIATRATAKQRTATTFDPPETDLFQKYRALAQYLPSIAR